MKANHLPNKTITGKLKTERAEEDLEKQSRMGKVTDDEKAETRKHKTKITQQKAQKTKNRTTNRMQKREEPQIKNHKQENDRKTTTHQGLTTKNDKNMLNMNRTHYKKQ